VSAAAEPGQAEEAEEVATGILDRANPELVERFAVIGSGEAECKNCRYIYSPRTGDDNYPVAKGTLFEARKPELCVVWLSAHSRRAQNLPSDWRCPTCGAEKPLFVSKARKVAGFSQNQGV
jgi:rubredoxin